MAGISLSLQGMLLFWVLSHPGDFETKPLQFIPPLVGLVGPCLGEPSINATYQEQGDTSRQNSLSRTLKHTFTGGM